jgi:GNAT superfamily N-acetyltransferase
MWRPDRSLTGPERAGVRDIDELNRVFSDAFTERYRRDGMSGVRVPLLNPAIWRYAIEDAAEGAMVWRNARGELVAFNMAHRSGTEGWMGPLAVRTDRQGSGLGRQIVLAGVAWLEGQGARTIGLETMPRTIDNIGFYSRLGFRPGHLTITLQREGLVGDGAPGERLRAVPPADQDGVIADCRTLADRIAPGADFTRELQLTRDLDLGDAALLRRGDGSVRAFALWHTAPLSASGARDELRILKLVADDVNGALAVIAMAEVEAVRIGLLRLAMRCQTVHGDLYARLMADGFRVHWTDLRMTLAGKEEVERKGILLSNWEI